MVIFEVVPCFDVVSSLGEVHHYWSPKVSLQVLAAPHPGNAFHAALDFLRPDDTLLVWAPSLQQSHLPATPVPVEYR